MLARGGRPVSLRSSDEELRTTVAKVRSTVARFSRDDAADITQEAVARAIHHNVPGNLEPWLKTVARRIAIDNARRRREFASGDAADVERLTRPEARTPEEVVVCNESVGLIRRAVRALPARYRDALVAYSEDRDDRAVAARFGLSTNATYSLLCRARARLREELARVGYAAGAVCMKLQRWQCEAATATAAACCVVVVAAGSNAGARPREAVPVEAMAPVGVSAPHASTAASSPGHPAIGSRRAPDMLSLLDEPVEIVRNGAQACGPDGHPLHAPHVGVVREGRQSIAGSAAKVFPKIGMVTAGRCRS